MDSQFHAGEPPSKRQLQIQGPRPPPLKVSKDSHKIKKPPHPPSHAAGPAAAAADQRRPEPVIIYAVSPKVIHAEESDFMSIVQRYTGLSSGTFSGDGDVYRAARLAATEKASSSSREKIGDVGVAGEGAMEEGLIRALPGILSPPPETLPEVAVGFFSPVRTPGGTFLSPAARLAGTTKGNPSWREKIGDVGVAGEGGMKEGLIRAPPGILSPASETLPAVAAGTFFSPAVAGGTFLSRASEARMMSADIIYGQSNSCSVKDESKPAGLANIMCKSLSGYNLEEQKLTVSDASKKSSAGELLPTEVEFKKPKSSHYLGESLPSKDSDYDFKEEQELKVNETFNKSCSVKDETKPAGLAIAMFKSLSDYNLEKQKLTVSDASKKSAAGELQPTEVEFKKPKSSHYLGESLPSKDSDYDFKEEQELKVNETFNKSVKDETKPAGLAIAMFKSLSDYNLEKQKLTVSDASKKSAAGELQPTEVEFKKPKSSHYLGESLPSKDSDYDFKEEQELKVNETFNKSCSVKDETKPAGLAIAMFKSLSDYNLEKQKLTVSDASKKSAAGESQPTEVEFKKPKSSHSLGESLPSKDSDYNFKEQELKINEGSGKRNARRSWTVLVHSDMVLGELPSDGCNWRKYGQKDILNARFPREYYRCAHRHTQGCFATKEVQREDEDPMFITATYKGMHTCTLAPDLMPPGPPEILAPLDTVLGADGNDKKDSQSNLQSSVHSPDNQTCISSTKLTSELPNLGLNLNVFPEKSFKSYPTWKNFYENEVRKNWKVLNRKKDVLLLLSSYPMIMIDKSDTDKWIIDVLATMRHVKSTEKILFGVGVAKHWPGMTTLQELSGRLQKLLDVPLMNDIEGVLPVDLVENLYRTTEADLRPLLEVEQNIISGKTSKSRGSASNSEGAAMEAEKELQPMPAKCKTLVEDTELPAKGTLNVPEEIFDLAIYLAVRQILKCINRGYIWCITISGRDKKRVLGAVKQHQDIVSEFGYIIVFTVSEDQSGANVHGVFQLQKGFWLGGCFDSVDLTHEYFDNLCSPGILLLTEDDYDKNMNLDQSTLPLLINLNKLVDHKHSDSRFIIFTSKMATDMEIRMEDHLLSWKLFCRIVGEGLLSPSIQQIAASLVKEYRGNLLAIILTARSLEKVTDDVNLWELAVKRLTMLPPSQIEDIDNVLINALTFIWERMNNKTRHCIKFFTWYPKGQKINRVSLIQHWIQDRLVDTHDEGTNIIQNLVDTSLLNIVELNGVQLRREIYDVLVNPLILQMHPFYLLLGRARLIKPPEEEEWDAKVINLMDNKLSDLPESPRSPSLIALYLQRNLDLMTIPSCFFKHMPLLQILDLSHTSIKSLPESLSSLVNLRELLLKGCELFIRLPSHVGELKNLEKLDLDETQIIDLPAEIGQLSKLKILRVSFYGYMNCSKTRLRQDTIIPPGTISGLSELTELSIDVDPDDERWNATVKDIIEEACNLKTLRQLNLYLPNIEILWKRRTGSASLLHYPLPRFRFTVGYHKRQVISRVPEEVEAHFNKSNKCLKFVKGNDIPAEMKKVLNHSTAFFLEGHATARSLSDFGIENTRLLKCCLLTECNGVKTIIDLSQGGGHSQVYTRGKGKSESLKFPEEQTDALGNLQDLNIYYMKNLESIWKGPVHKHCLASLKFLALHKCPRLSTIFSLDLVANLDNLEELIVEHCPQLTSLVSPTGHVSSNSTPQPNCFFPSLKRISLLYVPNLVSISSGLWIAPELEKVGFYNCPKLKSLSAMEMSSDHLTRIKGESHWWEALEWKNSEWGNPLDYLQSIFSPLIKERDVKAQLAEEGIMHHAST
ncbi:PREDICTED: uncharacterized protein LOC18607098 isoform X3 [Theobroma cacao]|uniref:Uncharacterized protein LOC18607098 isoform X3 n=1 Tax=Theobroma cacao TaxID=3641 RepID=A0AB32VSI4_THECC|nr:PREDICTED: uncharacterized protein LOC18607098 isoform X3 [Theobroma cacao]